MQHFHVLAEKGSPDRFVFPRPMTDRPGLDFSFSGLKTSAANTINQALKQEGELTDQNQSRYCLCLPRFRRGYARNQM